MEKTNRDLLFYPQLLDEMVELADKLAQKEKYQNMKLIDLIKNNTCRFDFLRQGFAYYNIGVVTEVHGNDQKAFDVDVYQFVIPLDDIGNGTLKAEMKAIECMRWIRKALESGELIRISHE